MKNMYFRSKKITKFNIASIDHSLTGVVVNALYKLAGVPDTLDR